MVKVHYRLLFQNVSQPYIMSVLLIMNQNTSHEPVRLVDMFGEHELRISSDKRSSSFRSPLIITKYLKIKLLSAKIECAYYKIKLTEEI